jgi:hypothetical protein
MATTRRKIRSLTDLNAKQTLQKVDGNDVIFEASGSLASGKVTVNVPLSASAIAVTGASGLIVNNGGVTINNNTGLVVNSNGITVNSGGASITGDLVAGANNVGALRSRVSTQLSGSTETSGSLTVGGNGGLSVTGGSISGSSTLQAGGNLTVGGNTLLRGNLDVEGNMVVRGQPTIINTEVLEVKDNIIVINKLSGSEAAYDTATGGLYVNRGNFETASLLWVSSSNDWQLQSTIGGTPTSADLSVNKLKASLISGSAGVSINSSLTIAATASVNTSGSFTNLSIPTSSVTVEGLTYKVFNLDTAIHAIDAALANAGLSANQVQSAYRALRFQYSGTLDANGEWSGSLPLTQESGKTAFPTTDFNYITTDVMIDENGRWINDLIAVDMEISSSAVWVSISAAAAPNTGFRLIVINENTASYTIS